MDAADLAIFRLQLEGIAERMQEALSHAAFSAIAREGQDCAAALFLADGRLLAQAKALPLLLGCLVPAVRGILDAFPVDAMREGDAYLLNDPWSGGTHLPDLSVVRPVLHEGRVVALTATILHHQDVGGMAPGSVPPDATDIWQEGLRLVPLQWRRNGEPLPSIQSLLLANTRTPQAMAGDLESQWSACSRGARELAEIVSGLGTAGFADASARLLAEGEALTRAALRRAKDGDYVARDALDGDGIDGRSLPVVVTLRKRGEALTIDFEGSSVQSRGPVNAAPAALSAAAFYLLRTLAPEAPSNHGCLAPLTLRLPEGSLVNPRPGAALNARTATVKLACNALLAAWAEADPEGAPAPNSAVVVVLSIGGEDASGKPFVFTEVIAGGAGAHPGGEGAPGIATDVGNGRNMPAEMLEAAAPILLERYEVRTGSEGTGRHRGGAGVRRVYFLREGRAMVSYRSERHESRAPGARGGGAGAPAAAQCRRADGTVIDLPSKARFEWRAGDRLVIETPGGGGWGEGSTEQHSEDS